MAAQSTRQIAEAAGYYIREGSYQGTTDDRLGRWYVGRNDDPFFRPFGAGYRTRREAWSAAAEYVRCDAADSDQDVLTVGRA